MLLPPFTVLNAKENKISCLHYVIPLTATRGRHWQCFKFSFFFFFLNSQNIAISCSIILSSQFMWFWTLQWTSPNREVCWRAPICTFPPTLILTFESGGPKRTHRRNRPLCQYLRLSGTGIAALISSLSADSCSCATDHKGRKLQRVALFVRFWKKRWGKSDRMEGCHGTGIRRHKWQFHSLKMCTKIFHRYKYRQLTLFCPLSKNPVWRTDVKFANCIHWRTVCSSVMYAICSQLLEKNNQTIDYCLLL